MNYYPSSCGLLAILRRNDSKKISGKLVSNSLDSIKYRGSDKGSGYAVFNLNDNNYKIKVFYNGDEKKLNKIISEKFDISNYYVENNNNVKSYCYNLDVIDLNLIDNVNYLLWKNRSGRIYSSGTSLNVFKGVGYPLDVSDEYHIDNMKGDLWLAHTRQPTNSPGDEPYWSHPFSTFNIAIIHNGDISSFGANRESLKNHGIKSFVGTDSEVISYIFRELLKKYDLVTSIKIMNNKINDKYIKYINRGYVLDGPYTVIIGYDDGSDLYLIGLTDKTKLRPVILGEDKNNYYIASEEKEIKLINKNARIWTLESDSYFIASLKKGLINSGRKNIKYSKTYDINNYDIDAYNIDYNKLDNEILKLNKKDIKIKNVTGHKYIGIKIFNKNYNLDLYGNAGNCLMNLNENNNANIYGNVADDCCDSMSGGEVKIYGSAGDVLGQAMNNGRIYIKGDAGNRCGIQLRAYDNIPYIVINGRFDDYLGEYMSGGVITVLSNNKYSGKYIGSGMTGGKIYIYGRVNSKKIGMQPDFKNNILRALLMESLIDNDLYKNLKNKNFIDIIDLLPEEAKIYIKKLYNKNEIPSYNYRYLNKNEYNELYYIIKDFDAKMNTNNLKKLHNKFTVIEKRI